MASSFAPVNHPPFAYDPSRNPTKSILKQKSRLSRSSSSWLSNINSKLSSASMNFTTESNIPSSFVNNNNTTTNAQQVQQQEPVPARSIGLLNFKKFINNNQSNDTHSITSNHSSLQQDGNSTPKTNNNSTINNNSLLDTDELAPDELKRVRFSVKQLTTEYYPYRNPTPPPSSNTTNEQQEQVEDEEKDEQPSPSSSIDAPELPENAAALLLSDHTEPQEDDATLEKAALCDNDKKKTPLELYEIACRNKEELPFPGFVMNLSQCALLTKIDLSNQPIQRRVIEPMTDVLGLGFDLQELILKNCDLEDDALKVLLHTLLLNDTLRHLNLADNKKLKTTGFKYIAIYVKGSRKLERLDLSNTNPDKKAIQYLAQALTASSFTAKSFPSLQQLLLDGCLLKLSFLEILASGVRKSPNLRYLSLIGNKISNQGAIWLGVMLRDYDNPEYIKGLEYLNLNNNDIRQGVQYIAQALRRNQSLTELHLHDCKLDSKACAFIGEALKYNQALLKLDISANSLVHPTAEGILAIKQALYVNWTLKELNMSASGLASEAAIYLAECLPENRSLRRIDLSKNMGIDLAGLMALSASVRCNDTLTYMDINIPPNDREMAKIQGDIVARCTKNAQNPAPPVHPQKKQVQEQHTVRHMGSQSSLDPNAMVTTAQATARLSLQERLAAVTRGKVSSGAINNKPTTPAEDIKTKATSSPPPKPSRQPLSQQQKKKSVVVDADMIITATSQINLFEDMLSAEISQRDDVVDSVQPAEDVILQVYGQCRKSQTEISGHIPRVTDDDELAQLLVLNDRLTTAISKYQQLFASGPAVTSLTGAATDEQEQQAKTVKKEEGSLISTTTTETTTKTDSNLLEEASSVKTSSSFLLEGTEPPLSTSFEIGDVDDEDDDLIPVRHPSPGIESQ
ncbi:hypothetical protein BDA99DRAFT_523622 [Phascolomyces articulosus]|uniref:GAT domain-containing protein n=1 Tax=Phascolomyces articulosus TaxID=60185 RepID=A0AAD5JQM1_9FUNG|nr:hypothetical protein BDA99DRAFT_523622 [Phascolomyces articulosus]